MPQGIEHPVIRRTVITQSLVMCIAIAGMIIIYLYQPYLIRSLQETLHGAGFTQQASADKILRQYYLWGVYAIILSFVMNELAGRRATRSLAYRTGTSAEYDRFEERIRRRAESVGMKPPQLLVMPVKMRLQNAAAMSSFFSGNKIMVVGDVVATLTDTEEEYMIAHELRHMRHRDMLFVSMIRAGDTALSIQKWLLMFTLGYQLIVGGRQEAVVIASVLAVMWVTHSAYRLLAAADSRAREYLADAGAVTDVGWKDREHLILGILRIKHAATGRGPLFMFGVPEEWRHSHPSDLNRARAIGCSPRLTSAGDLLLDDTTIRVR